MEDTNSIPEQTQEQKLRFLISWAEESIKAGRFVDYEYHPTDVDQWILTGVRETMPALTASAYRLPRHKININGKDFIAPRHSQNEEINGKMVWFLGRNKLLEGYEFNMKPRILVHDCKKEAEAFYKALGFI